MKRKVNVISFCLSILISISLMFSCANKDFRKSKIHKRDLGEDKCAKYLLNEKKSIFQSIKYKKSIILFKQSNIWSEIDEKKINRNNKTSYRYSHYYDLNLKNGLRYEFYLISEDNCNCNTESEYFKDINEKLTLYEEISIDTAKLNYILELGKSKFNNNFRLIVFGEEDFAESVAVSESGISIPKIVLDWKFNKYSFLITSTEKPETPNVYFNKSYLIDLNSLEILSEIESF